MRGEVVCAREGGAVGRDWERLGGRAVEEGGQERRRVKRGQEWVRAEGGKRRCGGEE